MWDETIYFGHCKILPCFWMNTSQSYPSREGEGGEGAHWREWVVTRWKHFVTVFKTPEAQESISFNWSTSWFHCQWVSQFRFPGESADRVSSFHSLRSPSYPFQHLGSSVHVVTGAQQCRPQRSLPARWWWCGGGPWGRARGKKDEAPVDLGVFSSYFEPLAKFGSIS